MSNAQLSKTIIFVAAAALLFTGCWGSSDAKPHEIISQPETAETELLNEALQAYERELYTLSQDLFRQLKEGYPTSQWAILAELKLADSYFYSNDMPEAITAYEEFGRRHPSHESMAYVRFMTAMAHLHQFRGHTRDQEPLRLAMKHFFSVVDNHPESAYSAAARRLIHKSRNMLARHELKVAQYYLNQELDGAAARRLCTVLRDYPDLEASEIAQTALQDHFADKPEVIDEAQKSMAALDQEKARALAPSVPAIVNAAVLPRDTISEISDKPVRARLSAK